jgi:hypothetical protein
MTEGTRAQSNSVPCFGCGKPSGMAPLDPWTIPAGARVGLVVTCGACMRERENVRPWTTLLATLARPEGEPPPPATDPEEGELVHVLARKRYGAWHMTTLVSGAVVGASDGWRTLGGAINDAVRAVVESRNKGER